MAAIVVIKDVILNPKTVNTGATISLSVLLREIVPIPVEETLYSGEFYSGEV